MVHPSRDAAPTVVQPRARVALFLLALALGCDFRFRCSGAEQGAGAQAQAPTARVDASSATPSGPLPNRAASP